MLANLSKVSVFTTRAEAGIKSWHGHQGTRSQPFRNPGVQWGRVGIRALSKYRRGKWDLYLWRRFCNVTDKWYKGMGGGTWCGGYAVPFLSPPPSCLTISYPPPSSFFSSSLSFSPSLSPSPSPFLFPFPLLLLLFLHILRVPPPLPSRLSVLPPGGQPVDVMAADEKQLRRCGWRSE